MDELKLFNLYENSSDKKRKDFEKNHKSSFKINHNYAKNIIDDEWLKIIEENLRYIDNILRNPNRFIINEEEVVKIELARRITVDSIKHLSKNTNFIQEITDNDEVKPSKILNINKEETFNTYENRLIYTLIKNLITYIDIKKKSLNIGVKSKNDKILNYQGESVIGNEKVSINLNINSSLNDKNNASSLEDRIKRVEFQIKDLTSSQVYKDIERAHVALVMPPIKKTNLILKNANFQRAMILWNYLQKEMEDNSSFEEGSDVIENDDKIKQLLDESFLVNYFILNSIDPDDTEDEKIKKTNKILINNLVQKLVMTNDNLTLNELNEMIDKEFQLVREKAIADNEEITLILTKAIEDYEEKLKIISLNEGENENEQN